MAASEATKELTWLRRLIADMGFFDVVSAAPLALNMDNHGAIALTSTEETKRSKHIDVRFHHVRDCQQQGLITVNAVPSTDNPADGLTKILRQHSFARFLSLIYMS